MISVSEALTRVISLMSPVEEEVVPLAEAAGRVLSQTVHAKRTQPPFPASAMDGYAVRLAESQPGMSLKVIGESAAGLRFDGILGANEAVRIFTGAPVPDGADSILIQEDANREGDTITVREPRETKSYIRPAGTDFSEGDPMEAPRRLNPQDIALLASMNIAQVPVRKRPEIALIPTGNELVNPGDTPGPDQIIASNSYGLKALFEAHGAICRLLPIARDTRDSLKTCLDLARDCDLIVTLGGASVGDHDLVQSVATEGGMALDFYKVAMRPGKPLMAGTLHGVPMVGLPGNPVSAMVCGQIFLLPALNALLGLPAGPMATQEVTLAHDISANGPREHYMRARLEAGQCSVFDRQDSSLLSVLGQANALAVRLPHAPPANKGETISVIVLN